MPRLTFVLPLLLFAASAEAQVSPASSAGFVLEVEISNSEIHRSVALMTAAGQSVNAAADFGLDRLFGRGEGRSRRQALRRFGQLWFVNLPIAALTHGMAHNLGHVARAHEVGIGIRSIQMTRWPWPLPVMGSVEYADAPLASETGLGVIGGGEQAAHVQQDLLVDRIYSRERAHYFDWILLGYAQLDNPAYAAWDLKKGRFRDEPTFFGTVLGDFAQYALVMADIEGNGDRFRMDLVRKHASRLRGAAWLNLADFALWAGVVRVSEYVLNGERHPVSPTLTVGKLRLVPGAYSTLTTLGPEIGFNARIVTARYLPLVQVRWIDTPTDRRLWAAGVGLRARHSPRLLPEFRMDLWQRESGGPGFRVQLGGRGMITVARRGVDVSVQIGYKSEGYLADAPNRAGALGLAGVAVKF